MQFLRPIGGVVWGKRSRTGSFTWKWRTPSEGEILNCRIHVERTNSSWCLSKFLFFVTLISAQGSGKIIFMEGYTNGCLQMKF